MFSHETVALNYWERDNALKVGLGRYIANIGKKDSKNYDPKRMQHNLLAECAGAVAEQAVASYLNIYWDSSCWLGSHHELFKHLPDLQPNIEVRRVRSKDSPVTMRFKERNDFTILVSVHVPTDIGTDFEPITLQGWTTSLVMLKEGESEYADSRSINRNLLSPISDLKEFVVFLEQMGGKEMMVLNLESIRERGFTPDMYRMAAAKAEEQAGVWESRDRPDNASHSRSLASKWLEIAELLETHPVSETVTADKG